MNHRTISLALVACLAALTGFATAAEPKKRSAKPARKPNPAFAAVKDVPGLPRVLLLGDSISIGYTVPVRKALQGKANVHRAPTNCGPTTKGVEHLDAWLGDSKWDVIHFNWGLHDLKYMGPKNENLADPKAPDSHPQVPPAEYEKNLREIVARLKKTGAKLIWRNTTPVPQGAAGRVVGDSVKYNAIAAKVMKENDIPIHDLYGFVQPQQETLMLKANVHFTPKGSEALGRDVARVIAEDLGTDDADLTLTVQTQFLGTATFGADNMTLDPSNTPGFAFQNAGSGDKNGATLLNYQRIDFLFSSPVTMDFLELRDIDTATSSGTQAWRDATTVELWNNAAPAAPGGGITPSVSLYSPTNLTVFPSTYPLTYTYATTLGNTLSSDRSAAVFEYDLQTADGFSIYLWNAGAGSGGKHGIVLQASGNRFLAAVPEPSTGVLILAGGVILARRKRLS